MIILFKYFFGPKCSSTITFFKPNCNSTKISAIRPCERITIVLRTGARENNNGQCSEQLCILKFSDVSMWYLKRKDFHRIIFIVEKIQSKFDNESLNSKHGKRRQTPKSFRTTIFKITPDGPTKRNFDSIYTRIAEHSVARNLVITNNYECW
jgi:hypothetical protein